MAMKKKGLKKRKTKPPVVEPPETAPVEATKRVMEAESVSMHPSEGSCCEWMFFSQVLHIDYNMHMVYNYIYII